MSPFRLPLPSMPPFARGVSMRFGPTAVAGLLACAAWQPLQAQPASDDPWTGRVQDPAIARKEAAAALAEGRRECARQPAAERAACLKLVQDEHAAALRRLGAAPAKRKP